MVPVELRSLAMLVVIMTGTVHLEVWSLHPMVLEVNYPDIAQAKKKKKKPIFHLITVSDDSFFFGFCFLLGPTSSIGDNANRAIRV